MKVGTIIIYDIYQVQHSADKRCSINTCLIYEYNNLFIGIVYLLTHLQTQVQSSISKDIRYKPVAFRTDVKISNLNLF